MAAGNDGVDNYKNLRPPGTVGTPGNAFNILSVANYDIENKEIAVDSSKGPTNTGRRKPDLAAPGSRIWAAKASTSDLVNYSGTSMAAPHVVGAVALMRQGGNLSPEQIRAILLNTASGSGWRGDSG